MFPAAAIGPLRYAGADTELAGYFIPKGTHVQVRLAAFQSRHVLAPNILADSGGEQALRSWEGVPFHMTSACYKVGMMREGSKFAAQESIVPTYGTCGLDLADWARTECMY